MDFLNQNIQVILAAIAVLVLLVVVLLTWRALGSRMSGRRGQRLGISEYYEIDKSRRLVLVRRDNVEHLILIGGGQDAVIETGITAAAIAAAYTPAPVSPDAAGFRPAPRAPAFGDRRPSSQRGTEPPLQQPLGREEPEL